MFRFGRSSPRQPGAGGIPRIFSYATWLDWFLMALATLCSTGTGAVMPIMIIVLGELVEGFSDYFTIGSTTTEDEFRDLVDRNALYIFCLFVGKFVLGYISSYAFRMSGIRISAAIRLEYLTSLLELPISAVDQLQTGSATDGLTNIADTIQLAISDKLGIMFQGFALIITAYIVAFVYSWRLTLVSSSVLVFIAIVTGPSATILFKHYTKALEQTARASGVAGEVLQGIRTIKSLGAEDEVRRRHGKFVDQANYHGSKMSIGMAMQIGPSFFATYANMALSFWAGLRFYSDGLVSGVGDLFIVLFATLLVTTGLTSIFSPIQALGRASSASVACFKIIDSPKSKLGELRPPHVDANQDIKFEHVQFAYPSRPRTLVLQGISCTVQYGRTTAFVGHSGCGKSTLVALLERWYGLSDVNQARTEAADDNHGQAEQTQQSEDLNHNGAAQYEGTSADEKNSEKAVQQNAGRIMVGELNIEEIDCKWWRSQIGLVQQEPVLFDETIYDNVAKGLTGSKWENDSREDKLQRVKDACSESFADEFIKRLPHGYDTPVGQGGIKLSGGQRQRLAIARSIIKQPSILILDEATSSIDVRSERLVAAALERVSAGRTTIVIAHRLSTIRNADHIVVLHHGTVREQGTHEELVNNDGGFYSNLVKTSDVDVEGTGKEHQMDALDPPTTEKVHAMHRPASSEHESAEQPSDQLRRKVPSFQSVVRLLREQKTSYPFYFLVLVGAIGAAAGVAIQAWLFAQVVTVFEEPNMEILVKNGNFWSLMLFVLANCVAICGGAIGYFSNVVSFRVSTAYRKSYFHSVVTKPISWFDEEDHSFGTVTGELSGDPQRIQDLLGYSIVFPLIGILQLIGCTIVSFVFGWKLSLVVFFASLPVILISSFLRFRYEMKFEAMNASVFSQSSKFAAEAIASFRTVTALTLEDATATRYKTLLDGHINNAFKKSRFTTLIFALSDSLDICSVALAFWYGGQLLASSEYEPFQFFVIQIALIQGAQGAGTFLATGPNFANATAAANRILARREDSEAISDKSNSRRDDSEPGCKVEFQHVSFRYPTRDIPVYKELSFTIKPGEFVAFVGPSGCGKSTIISLLDRFYDVQHGCILVDDQDITTISLAQYRTWCGLVTQEPTLFEGTIRENLVLGLPQGVATPQNELEAACKAARAHDFVTSLSESFDTPITGGTHSSFSGGQKQRLCIARALLRKPRMLILDEATNSLDSVSEGLIQKAIEELRDSKSLTIIAIAHRLATVRRADQIYVMGDGGVLLEHGSHEQLLQRKGAYWDMCKVQAVDT